MVVLSVLDLARVNQGSDPREALSRMRETAMQAERLGYNRYWVAEHHNMVGIACAATSVVLAHAAAVTSSIRLGAGGVILPNHAPMVVAEHFGTLAQIHPERIDLGVARAPETDQVTLRALRRAPAAIEDYPQDILELQHYFAHAEPGQRVQAVPATGTAVPLWIVDSTVYGARLAAELGLPYAFGSHFAPDAPLEALDIYRPNFKPSLQLVTPYAMVAVNIVAAETDAEARRLATTQQMTFVNMVRGSHGLSMPPIDDIDDYWSATEQIEVERMLKRSIYGSPETVRSELLALADETCADELLVVSDIFYQAARLRSPAIIADGRGWD